MYDITYHLICTNVTMLTLNELQDELIRHAKEKQAELESTVDTLTTTKTQLLDQMATLDERVASLQCLVDLSSKVEDKMEIELTENANQMSQSKAERERLKGSLDEKHEEIEEMKQQLQEKTEKLQHIMKQTCTVMANRMQK